MKSIEKAKVKRGGGGADKYQVRKEKAANSIVYETIIKEIITKLTFQQC